MMTPQCSDELDARQHKARALQTQAGLERLFPVEARTWTQQGLGDQPNTRVLMRMDKFTVPSQAITMMLPS